MLDLTIAEYIDRFGTEQIPDCDISDVTSVLCTTAGVILILESIQ